MVNSRGGTFTPSQQTIVTGVSHSPHGSHHSTFSAGASPSTNSPTGSNSLTKIVVAQVYLLLSTIKEDNKDRTKWEQQAEQLRKLIDEHGMEVFQKYFSRLVVGNAPTIFPGINRPVANPATYPILHDEVGKISHDVDQARRIAESIETANEDIFRDFDLSTFMDHFKLDALEKTILALAFKTGSRSDLKTKADAIISANYPQFLQSLVNPGPGHEDMSTEFLALIVDRFIQEHPPNFDEPAQRDLIMALQFRYQNQSQEKDTVPTTVLAAVYLMHALNSRNPLVAFLQRVGSAFTTDEESCRGYLRSGNIGLNEEVVAGAIIYTTLSRSIPFSTDNLINSLRMEVSPNFNWQRVIGYFDQDQLRISKDQFLALYKSFRPLAVDGLIDIQQLWGGTWQYSETQLSFISAYASLYDTELDATTIPGLEPAFTLEDFEGADDEIRQRAAQAIKHPLVSVVALSSMFHVALHTTTASDTVEAKRLFQEVVVPNLDVFLVSAFGVPKPWPELATDTINNLFDRFLYKYDPNYDFVLEGLWRKDKQWVAQRLVEAHAKVPMELPTILDHALRHHWLDDLASIPNGFGLDLVAVASARGFLDLDRWAASNLARIPDLPHSLLTFLNIKAEHELAYQRQKHLHSVMLPVKTIAKLLQALEDAMPRVPSNELILVQRACITAYPRLINYGEGFDDIIDANGAESNSLPKEANEKMEAHYKQMYSDEVQVRSIVEALERYKHSRDPADQDVFACMIHGLFDEYALYQTYPLEALATTAVLFGGIISQKLISELPLKIGLGMILEAVKDYSPQDSMYKFGLQALMQLFSRLREWPGFCKRLLEVPGLQNTEAWGKAEDVVRAEQDARVFSPVNGLNGGELKTPPPPAFNALRVDPPRYQLPVPDEEITDKIQFVLNNISIENIESKFNELQELVTEEGQHWFATHLVQERARMQPNYHNVYLDTIKLFGRKTLWADILRETYVSTFRTLNSESTMQNALERTHLKNLATWLGSLTLARDKPIKHRNIAFKQLLIEGYESHRLLVVIPFVCKVLAQGKYSTVFKPPNPWVMDIIKALMELYNKADLKLNLRFEIEVLCGELDLDHKSIVPSDEIMNRISHIEEATEVMAPEVMDRFDNLSLNGMAGGVGGRFSPHEITASIPDLGPLLQYPPVNDMVNQGRLQDIMKAAITRAVHEIISPVVERSVTIAAISTAQMIHKDFATEPNEARVRAAAINMVKKTAGALALVTSKEPLRASMTNYIRALSGELPQGLPEGTIIMCVTSNLDLACSQVEKKAEERAVPEIEEMIESELEARRHHKMTRPDEPYVDPGLSRWSWTIPDPFKLSPALGGLNQSQMAIYDEFARQPRAQAALPGPTHIPSSSDATRTMANEILQDSYPPVPNLPTPAEPPAMPHLPTQQPAYTQQNNAAANGRLANMQMDPRMLAERVEKALVELERVAADTPEQHVADLPRPHAVLDTLDALYGLIFRSSQGPDHYDYYIVDHICNMLFNGPEQDLVMECLVQVLENICRMAGRTANRVFDVISQRSGDSFFRVPLIVCLTKAHLLEWGRIDLEISRVISQRKDGSLQFFLSLLETVLLNDRPVALYADFAKSLEIAWLWITEEPDLEVGQQLKQKLSSSGLPEPRPQITNDRKQDQLLYIFEEWVRLCSNPNASENAPAQFIAQMYNRQQINNREDLHMFLRLAIDNSVDRFEQHLQNDSPINEAYSATDSLAKLIALLVKGHEQDGAVKTDKAAYLNSILSLTILVLNHHHVLRGDSFNQKPFYRLYSTILCELDAIEEGLSEEERQEITLVFARIFLKIPPTHFPGFMTSWMGLISHRKFMPVVLGFPKQAGWGLFADIMETLLFYVGELLKPVIHLDPTTSQLYRAVVKLVIILHHDFPEFLSANHSKLCVHVPSYSTQLNNLILSATPPQNADMPNPMQPGLKIDRVGEIRQSPESMNDVEGPLRDSGLFDLVEQALEHGPSEDAVAHIAHEIQRKKTRQSGSGLLPVDADRKLIDSLVLYVGTNAIARSEHKGAPLFSPGTPDLKLLSMLVHELRPATRFVFLGSIVNQLRFPNTQTHYFNQALLELFGSDANDQEELEIREQITRILLERSIGQWPQPWGLLVVIQELVKNKKYMFFDLPFIKSAPEVGERFLALVQAGPVQ